MTEKYVGDAPERSEIHDNRQHVHEYFFSHATSSSEREYYESRNLTFTNNLHLWFVDEPDKEIVPGFENPYNYRQRPFGPILDRFRIEYPELWQGVQQTMQAKRFDMAEYAGLLKQEDITLEILSAYEEKQKEYSANLKEQAAVAKSHAFDVLAPQLLDAGIDPLDLCR